MKAKTRIRHEILLATSNGALLSSFKRESSAHDFILDTVDSPQKLIRLSKKEMLPGIILLDLDSMSKNLSAFIFYLKRFRGRLPMMVITHKTDAALLNEVNKNLSVVLFLPLPTTKRSFKEVLAKVRDYFNEDLKKKLSKVEYLKKENVFACTFENEETLFINRSSIPDGNKTADIQACEISSDKYYFMIQYDDGESTDVPWDFVRHIADKQYEYYAGGEKKKNANLTAEEIGKRVCDERKDKNMTQDELASQTGMLRNNISRIEHGHHYPSLPVLEKIAEALGVPVVHLVAK